jgi:tyrosine-protein kinase Etk/Wzc
MNQKESMNNKDSNQVDVLDVLIAIAKHKIFIFKVVGVVAIISLVISLLWPNTYRSTSTFLPPKQTSVLPGGLGGLVGSALGGLGMSSAQLNAEAALNILKSRSIREELIHTFNLAEVYKQDVMEFLLEDVQKKTTIDITREGGFGFSPLVYIELSFDDREPWRAKQVVEFYLAKLDSTIRAINIKYAENSFDMVNMRYLQNLADLARAEEELNAFQKEFGVFEVEEQAKILIQSIAQLKSTQIEVEVQINVLRQTVGDNNSELQNLRRTRTELERQIRALVEESESGVSQSPFFALADVPDLALNYMRLYREVVIQSKVLEAIYPQVQYQEMMTRINTANIQIVDEANLPTYKHSPKRALIVVGGIFFGIFLSLTIVFYREVMEKGEESDSEYYHKIKELSSNLSFSKKREEA